MSAYQIEQAIAETPWWLIVIFIAFVILSLNARKPRFIHYNELLFLPFSLLVLSFLTFCIDNPISMTKIGIWISCIAVGMFLGWLQFVIQKVRVVPQDKQVYLPGSSLMFLVVPILIGLKFYYGFDVFFLSVETMRSSLIPTSIMGITTGLALGRLFYIHIAPRKGLIYTKAST